MKIAMITHEYPPNIRGGCGISCGLLVENLRKNGIYVDVFVFDKKGTTVYNEMGDTYYFNIASHLPQILNFETLLKLRISKNSYDLIHVYGVTQISVLKILQILEHHTPIIATLNGFEEACANFSRLIRTKCVHCGLICNYYCVRDSNNKINRPKIFIIPKYVYFNIQRWLSKKIDYYIALSDSIKEIYISAGFPKDKITVIPNMLDPTFLEIVNNSNIEKYGLPRNNKVILYVGNLNMDKGVDVLINSFSKLSISNIELWIVGTGIHESKIKTMAKESPKKDFIKFFGFTEYEKLPSFYKAADVFVHPGIRPEAFGRTIIEAMVCKLPIITSDAGAPPKIVGDSGLIFKAGDSNQLTQRLEQILNDEKLRKRLTDLAFSKAMSEYSDIKIVKKIIMVYKKLIEGNDAIN